MRKRGRKSPAPKAFFYTGTIVLIIAAAFYIVGLSLGFVPQLTAEVDFTISFSLLLSFAVISYLLHKGRSMKRIINELGLSRKALTAKTVGYGLLLFAVYIIILFAIASISIITGAQISSNVQQAIGGYPLWAIAFLAVIAPINEEIAFRGFLVPRIGVIASGLIFGVLHFGYGSVSEIVVALWFGITGGYVFKKTKSLYPTVITHVMVNTITAITVVTVLHPLLIMVH